MSTIVPEATGRSTYPAKARGFSLVEMAIVLVVIGLLMGGLLLPLSVQMENADRDRGRSLLSNMSDALMGYAVTYGRLPCPDVNGDGGEDPPNGVGGCAASEGQVPASTLGVPGVDAWGQSLRYRVTGGFADATDGTGCGTATPGVSFSLCSQGDIRVLDGRGGRLVAGGLPAVLLSRGKNWAVPPSADERENSNGDRVFVSRTYSAAEGAAFDDLVLWISPNVLKNRMVEAKRLP